MLYVLPTAITRITIASMTKITAERQKVRKIRHKNKNNFISMKVSSSLHSFIIMYFHSSTLQYTLGVKLFVFFITLI